MVFRGKVETFEGILTSWGNKCSQSNNANCRNRRRYDAGRISKMADKNMKHGVRKAMVAISELHTEFFLAGKPLDAISLGRADVAMAIIIYLGTWAGMDGEWCVMRHEEVCEALVTNGLN